MKICLISTCLFFAAGWAGSALADEHTTDSFQQIGDNLNKKKALLVDVREPKEHEQGFIRGAALVPLSLLEKATADLDPEGNKQALKQLAAVLAQQLPKEKILYTYCASGVRSVAAGKILSQMGYDVRPLKTGYKELVAAGYPHTGEVKEAAPAPGK